MKDNDILPTDEIYASADVIMLFVVPKNLTSFSQTPKLKLFQALTAGNNHLSSTAYFKSIPLDSKTVFSTASGIHSVTIAEHCLASALILFHTFNSLIILGNAKHHWLDVYHENMNGMYVREIRDSTVGIIGYGSIGAEVGRLFKAAGSKIIALNRSGKPSTQTGYLIKNSGDPDGSIPDSYYSSTSMSDRKEFFNQADVIVDTLPSMPGTKHFVGELELKEMKGDALFINIGRGDTVDQEKLVEALTNKVVEGEETSATGTLRIGGASLDVCVPEPLPSDHILWTLPNVIITPHMSSLSTLYYHRAIDLLTQQVERLRDGKEAFNVMKRDW